MPTASARAPIAGLPELPSVFTPVIAMREGGDALSRAIRLAPDKGAGTLVWVRSAARIEAAVVLEPELILSAARPALFAAASALADALAAFGPPEVPLTFAWPATLKVNGAEVGRVRMAWPAGAEDGQVPAWLVVAMEARLSFPRGWDPGHGLHQTALAEEGWEDDATCQELTAAWARHLMANIAEWQRPAPHGGVKRLAERFLARLERDERAADGRRGIDPATGDLVVERDGARHVWSLRDALRPAEGA
ncbi:biotin/lipoate--protein ligase family protein [Falsiroseomonas sp. CW058]|uniref:biotin/lipoate--protein ligase family protein n=1 Tax=Falsiroseomonas sp. CW058 TaxID=3388664 RepID=UPI003D30F819